MAVVVVVVLVAVVVVDLVEELGFVTWYLRLLLELLRLEKGMTCCGLVYGVGYLLWLMLLILFGALI